MKDWQLCLILLEAYYQIEVPFPVAHLTINQKTGFALVIVISNSRGNILYNYNVKIRMHMGNWQQFIILLGVHYQVEIPFPALHFKKKGKNRKWNLNFVVHSQQQEMELQFGSIPQVKSCKIAILSFASRENIVQSISS